MCVCVLMYEKEADSSPFFVSFFLLLLIKAFSSSIKPYRKYPRRHRHTQPKIASLSFSTNHHHRRHHVLPVVVFRVVVGRTGLPRAKLLRRGVLRRRATNGAFFSWSFLLSFSSHNMFFDLRAIFNPSKRRKNVFG